MSLEHMEEVKTAEQFVVRAYGRISLVAEADPDERLAAAMANLVQAVTALREWMSDCPVD